MEHKEGNLEIMINQFYDATANINKSITNMVKELEPGRYLSYEQIETMHFIHHNEKISINDLANKQCIYKTAISKRVKKLEYKGYVQRVYSNDKRIKLVSLTHNGERLLKEIKNNLTKEIKLLLLSCFVREDFEKFMYQLMNFENTFLKKYY
ncbi:MarR family winged helix-turn-helix transcriptional regulator (plasmid) [Staphylococcus xylosus]|jgi:DNA-binding MarR family transcriptional regulator|uniref:MarR family transcriptional regulator n=1 Tax=Staphylococcus shinii TaxID=2912228 RepID=A0A418ICE7_9STAP|nr:MULTISPECIES: MarR family transcriptional regulator [Staphylococcus]MRF36786.1 MarR family transcriptional regulator [Staphylococcus sp. KY49P]MCA2501277.1 MarR family transcriptional regulator [Staphylococcus xylosus]MCA2503940.1 MarR family transcriptional regulator [Staphylococcus xylosus]MCE7781733.1 MarR family transcriptional regulator [Staphylococcus xylosus]MDW8571617.1 MarR family transcriptional regulator [Staphylococcus shinii]